MKVDEVEIILYVADQQRSQDFYSTVLDKQPELDVPGMTEFSLSTSVKLGLMPENGIARILAGKTPHPSTGSGIPRCELYLRVDDLTLSFDRALGVGGKEVSAIRARDWGDTVGYLADPDGHIIAFAAKS
jgi:uncharacterized glyoxalase superfamily protein PhnB